MHTTKNPKYYIASGFFNENQITDVKTIENKLTESGVKFYSPRLSGIMLGPSGPLRNLMIDVILHENISRINQSERTIVNMRGNDIGTLWEAGYSLSQGLHTVVPYNDDDKILENFMKIIYQHQEHTNPDEEEVCEFSKVAIVKSSEDIEKALKWVHYSVKFLICIDDRVPELIMLAGYLYGIVSPTKVFTYSSQDHGSNLMLAGAISNHYQFLKNPEAIKYEDLLPSLDKSSFSKVMK